LVVLTGPLKNPNMKKTLHTAEGKGENGKLKAFFEITQAVLTCCAILAGGWWFIAQRQGDAKAICSHKLSVVSVNHGGTNFLWGCLEMKIANAGLIPIDLSRGILKVSLVKPVPDQWDLKWEDGDTLGQRVSWPQLFYRDDQVFDHILPGEEDYKYFEFTMPTNVETFRVYSYLTLGKVLGTNPPLGWAKVSIYRMENGKAVQLEAKTE
jgi:hypothetical protein